MSITWKWLIESANGVTAELSSEPPSFTSQSDAESWLGEVWRDLVEAGAVQATLLEDDHVAYGPMSLRND
jgi:hypothetical protein